MAVFAYVFVVALAAAQATGLLEQQRLEEARAHYRTGEEFMLRESFEEAVAEYRRATELDPSFMLAHYGMGQAFMALKRYSEAVSAYTASRDTVLRQASLGQNEWAEQDRRRRDEIRELEESLQRVRSGQIKGIRGTEMGAQVLGIEQRIRVLKDAEMKGAGAPPRVPAEVALALGSAHFRMGHLDDAEKSYREAVNADSKHGAAHNNLAVIYMMTNRLQDANEAIRRAEKNGFKVSPQFKRDLEGKLKAQ